MDDINFQSQLDPPFLLTESAGEVAKHFNKIANIEKIDIANANIKKMISEIESSKKHKENDLKKEEEKLETFVNLRKFEIEVEALEMMENELTIKRNRRKQLKSLITSIVEINEAIEENKKILSLDSLLTKLFEDKKTLENLQDDVSKLKKLILSYKNDSNEIEECNKLISIDVLLQDSIKLINDKDILIVKRDRLSNLIKNAKSISIGITEAEIAFNNLHEQFDKEMPEVCPLCDK